MHFSLEAHSQVVRDRQQALLRDAAAHRLVAQTRPCSRLTRAFWRAAAGFGRVTLTADGCRRRARLADAG